MHFNLSKAQTKHVICSEAYFSPAQLNPKSTQKAPLPVHRLFTVIWRSDTGGQICMLSDLLTS